ncbi:hypothetical protein LTR95_000294 [Oleoguttula sp. CCFEE 5521]|uniref:HIT domain-containing protein n=1 Tax=Cryoendolithus antarcticus TaxID=1507870 RepID=A0A1V8TLU9_9PEZI|nr:hypothetical protein B0A48_02999 [Cryoendolithus antarcticus]
MSSINERYPVSCAFCKIAKAYPAESSPVPANPDPELIDPGCYLILSTPQVMAFLDIMPIAPGHILLTTRPHYEKLSDMYAPPKSTDWASEKTATQAKEVSQAIGEWLPIVSRALCAVTGIEDWNVVQNNGERAAQVVPHVHFHLIPRYQEGRREIGGKGKVDYGMLKSWKVFGRGSREDLDEEEAQVMASSLREALKVELGGGKAKL